MRVYLTLFLLLAIGFTSNAQLEKGRHFAGLQTTLLSSDIYSTYIAINSSGSISDYGVNLVPTYGWAASRNWLIGAQVTLGYLKSTNHESDVVSEYYDLGFAPFTRLYLDVTRNGRFKIFGLASIEIAGSKTKNRYFDIDGGTTQGSDVHGVLGGGLSYFSKKLAFDVNISHLGIRMGVYKTFGKPSTKPVSH